MSEKSPRHSSTFSKYAKGLLSRPTTAGSHEHRSSPSALTKSNLRDLSYTAPNAISAIAASPDQSRVVIAGRELLTILQVDASDLQERHNLRIGNRAHLNYSSNDVKWGTGATASLVATATSNGSILTWDLESSDLKTADRIINAHNRAVNRIDFNPGNGSWLLSASQDGSMKLWDLRDRDGSARFILHGKAEAVRDVQFNSTNALELAAVYDNGTLQKWDLRNPKIYERKLNAHNGLALTLNWHADGKHLVTGGRDKIIKIWDMKSDTRKPCRFLSTMAPVARVAWRPGSTLTNCQIASCAFSMDNNVNLWNLNRPFVASRTFESHTAAPTGILWKDVDILWSCSKDRTFRQQTVALSPEPIDSLSHYAFGWSTNDDIAMCLGNRKVDKQHIRSQEKKLTGLPTSRSDTTISSRKSHKGRHSPLTELATESLQLQTSMFRPVQSFAIVFSDDNSSQLFKHLASKFVTSCSDPIRASAINAQVAYRAQQPEKSKSWKLIKLVLEHLSRVSERGPRCREPSMNESLTLSRLGDSLLRRDLDRLRLTPRLGDSGHSTMRGSPATSFIMPKYNDSIPPLSLPSTTVSRFRAADSVNNTKKSISRRKSSNESSKASPSFMILPRPATLPEEAVPGSSVSDGDEGPLVSHEASRSTTEETKSPSSLPAIDTSASPTINATNANTATTETPTSTTDGMTEAGNVIPTEMTAALEQSRMAVRKTVFEILEHYKELGDVQMCSTISLVLADYITVPSKQLDNWTYCYLELLQRFRLFSTASEVFNHTRSDFIRSLAEGDVVMHSSCSRCKKAVPLMRERGNYWMCPRCQNTVQCIVCGVVIKGLASWCRTCAHAAHYNCRARAQRELETGVCVVPDCGCSCSRSGGGCDEYKG